MASVAWAALSIRFDDFLKRCYKGNASSKSQNENYQKRYRVLFKVALWKLTSGPFGDQGYFVVARLPGIWKWTLKKWDRFICKAALWKSTSGRFRDQGYFVVARLLTNLSILGFLSLLYFFCLKRHTLLMFFKIFICFDWKSNILFWFFKIFICF